MNVKSTTKASKKNLKGHPFHIVDPSPWPFLMGIAVLGPTIGGVAYMHGQREGGVLLGLGLLAIICILIGWWGDVIREATMEGCHTVKVQDGLKLGMKLFIVSEVMFFFGFFWAFFHCALEPSIWIDCVWPPAGIPVIETWKFPLLNTLILLTSGVTVTWGHHEVRHGDEVLAVEGLVYTIGLAINFTAIQFMEYAHANFTISDGIYGSCFYMLTGFHGFHVIIGTIFLVICLGRLILGHFTPTRHLGLEFAIWYWHFVDIVWIFLFVFVYAWGNSMSAVGV